MFCVGKFSLDMKIIIFSIPLNSEQEAVSGTETVCLNNKPVVFRVKIFWIRRKSALHVKCVYCVFSHFFSFSFPVMGSAFSNICRIWSLKTSLACNKYRFLLCEARNYSNEKEIEREKQTRDEQSAESA